jgi:hypothetical protein
VVASGLATGTGANQRAANQPAPGRSPLVEALPFVPAAAAQSAGDDAATTAEPCKRHAGKR